MLVGILLMNTEKLLKHQFPLLLKILNEQEKKPKLKKMHYYQVDKILGNHAIQEKLTQYWELFLASELFTQKKIINQWRLQNFKIFTEKLI